MKNPTYQRLGDHTEAFQIDYDPEKISYRDILKLYWSTHNHCATPQSRQYMSAIFYADEEQRKIAVETGTAEGKRRGQPITTSILPLKEFYLAEGYHQKYKLRQRPDLWRELAAYYHPDEKAFLNSTAAARVNAYVGGHGTFQQLQKEIDGFGLSPQGRQTLMMMVKQFGK